VGVLNLTFRTSPRMKKFGYQPRSRTVLKSVAPAMDDTLRPFFLVCA
jgi:hypothetical protein